MDPDFDAGVTRSVYWVRVQIHCSEPGSKVVLFIRPSYLSEVRLYEASPDNPSRWKTRVEGNRYPYAERDRASVALSFVVTPAATDATYYLRTWSRSELWMELEALPPEEADQKDHQRDLLEVFFITSMLAVLLWILHSYMLDRKPVVVWFALHQAVYTLFGIVATGYFALICPAGWPQAGDWLNALLYLAINFTCVQFCRGLFEPYDPPPLLRWILRGFAWTFPVLLAALFLDYRRLAIEGNQILIHTAFWCYLITAFCLRKERLPKRLVLRIAFTFLMVCNAAFWYSDQFQEFAAKVNPSAVQVLVLNGLVFGLLFAWVLNANARQAILDGQRSAMELLLVKNKLQTEQDLKKQIEIQARTDYLTGVHNRRRFIELAECELARAIRYERPLALLVIDIDHFKAINDAWGHATGDYVLQQVAQLIHGSLRCNDIFGRTGGEEFAALIPETQGREALEVAERLCGLIADAPIVPPGAEQIKVSVSLGLAELAGREIAFSALLDEADQAMYCAKQSGRSRVCKSAKEADAEGAVAPDGATSGPTPPHIRD